MNREQTEKQMMEKATECGNQIAADILRLAAEEGFDPREVFMNLCDKAAEANERRRLGLPVDLREFFPEAVKKADSLVWNNGKPFSSHQSLRTRAVSLGDLSDAT